jgi:hypothetical protein
MPPLDGAGAATGVGVGVGATGLLFTTTCGAVPTF